MNNSGHRRALLVGATGLVGSKLLTGLVQHDGYNAIATLGRRAPNLTDARVTHHVDGLSDLQNIDLSAIHADVLFCCLGTTIKRAGSQKAFRAIDYELVVAIARQAVASGISSFFVVSSVGADPESSNFYLRTKGEMEQTIGQLGFSRSAFFRPSLLLGTRSESRPAEQLGQHAARLFNPLLAGGLARYRAVDAGTVATAMIGLDQTNFAGIRVIEGREIQSLAVT